jgi:imidazolonepropionase-like amidohydrolase
VADRVVSIEPRKDADLRMLSGYPLDVMTKVQKAFINGELVYPR